MSSESTETLQRLTSRSAVFIFASFLQSGIGFLLIPVYTTYLTTADYGALAIATTFSGVLTILYLQSFEGVFTRFYYDIPDDREVRGFFGSVWFFQLAWIISLSLILELVGRSVDLSEFVGIPYDPYLRLVVWTTFLSSASLLLPRALFLVREQAWRYASLNIALSVLSMALIVYFVVTREQGAVGSIRGTFYASLIVGVLALPIVVRNIRMQWNVAQIREALAFALPVVPHLLSLWILNLADRLILQRYVGLDEVGIYSLGYQIGSALQIVAIAVATSMNPYYSKTASTDDGAETTLPKLTTYYILFLAWTGIAIVALAPGLLGLIHFRPGCAAAARVVPWIVFSSFIRGFYFVFVNALFYSKRVQSLPFVTGAAALTNIGLNFLLIPRFGYIAAAVTDCIAYIVQVALVYFFAQRAYPLRYEWKRLATLTAFAIGWTLGLAKVTLENAWLDLGLSILLVLAFPAGLWTLRFFSPGELRQVRRLIRGMSRPRPEGSR